MLSLTKNSTDQPLFHIEDGDKTPVYFFQKRDPAKRNVIESLEPVLKQPSFREEFDLSLKTISELVPHLEKETVPEDSKLRKTYFAVKRRLNILSYTEMSLVGEDSEFTLQINPNRKAYAGTWFLSSSSNGGKTHFFRELVLDNWSLPQTRRRPLLLISCEESIDRTLIPLKKKRYEKLYTGLDCSQQAYEDWLLSKEGNTPEQWFKKQLLPVIRGIEPYSMCCGDDLDDSPAHAQLQHEMERLMRVGRHSHVSPLFILGHKLKSGNLSIYRQLGNSVKFRILFPRSGKHKVVMFLVDELQMKRREAVELVNRIIPHSRWLAIHQHSPVYILSAKYARLL